METIVMNTGNSKANEPQKFVLSGLQRLDLKSSDKYVVLQNLSIYCTLKNIQQQRGNDHSRNIYNSVNI